MYLTTHPHQDKSFIQLPILTPDSFSIEQSLPDLASGAIQTAMEQLASTDVKLEGVLGECEGVLWYLQECGAVLPRHGWEEPLTGKHVK